MHKKSLFTIAALSATCLLPMPGVMAQTETNSAMMEVGQFQDSLNHVKDMFSKIRENHMLLLAAQDPLIASNYEGMNRRLMSKALGTLDQISRNWKMSTPTTTGDASIARLGTADAVRYANESEDTAFVRQTVWDVRNSLHADTLNGRDPVVSDDMVAMIDAAIERSENPNFKVAWKEMDRAKLSQNIVLSQRDETVIAPAPVEETTPEVVETPAPPQREERVQEETAVQRRTRMERENIHPVEAAPIEETSAETTYEETPTERYGAADLPQTGGDPGLLIFLGSSLAGLGALIRKRS